MLRSGRLFGCREMPFVQLRQLLVKKFHLPGGEAQKPGPKTPEDFAEEFFIGNTEKNLLQIDNKRCIIYKWLWKPDASSTDRDFLPVLRILCRRR